MKYLGNIPDFNIIHSTADRYDYVNTSNPATDTNPSTLYATWLNATTGELFICKDNTVDENEWIGTSGTTIAIDQYASYVSLLLPLKNTLDYSQYSHTLASYGSPTLTTTAKNYTNSYYFDESDDAFAVPDHSSFDIGTNDFCVEAWVYRQTTAAEVMILSRQVSSSTGLAFQFRITGTGELQGVLREASTAVSVASSATIATSTWTHVAMLRNSGTIKLFIDGTQDGSLACSYSLSGSEQITIAALSTSPPTISSLFKGNIEDIRLTVGVPRYTAAFTPPAKLT